LIKALGRWEPVTGKGVWEQVQIRRAVALGLGARAPEGIEFLTADLTGDNRAFAALAADIRRHTGLGHV
jgi:hypothetical protein